MRATAMVSALTQYLPVYEKKKVMLASTYEQIRLIGENTAKLSSGSYISLPYKEIQNPTPPETRTGEEIAADVIEKMGLEVVE